MNPRFNVARNLRKKCVEAAMEIALLSPMKFMRLMHAPNVYDVKVHETHKLDAAHRERFKAHKEKLRKGEGGAAGNRRVG